MWTDEEIESAVLSRFTGNRTHDLIGFDLRDLERASAAWEREANRRYQEDEVRRRRGDRYR
jgi:hypothetical protein